MKKKYFERVNKVFKLCKYQMCAVCKNINERDVFKSILKNIHPETYICEHAAYAIKSSHGGEFIITRLDFLKNTSKGYYVIDMYIGNELYLNTSNVTIICTKQGKTCEQQPFVVEYKTTKKGS